MCPSLMPRALAPVDPMAHHTNLVPRTARRTRATIRAEHVMTQVNVTSVPAGLLTSLRMFPQEVAVRDASRSGHSLVSAKQDLDGPRHRNGRHEARGFSRRTPRRRVDVFVVDDQHLAQEMTDS